MRISNSVPPILVVLFAALLAGCSAGNLFGAAEIPSREPYVQSATSTSAVISWVSKAPGKGEIEYGPNRDLVHKQTEKTARRQHSVKLSGLRPDSTYGYRAGASTTISTFRTAPGGDGTGFTFAVVGDSGDGGADPTDVAGLPRRMDPALVLHTGDVVYDSGAMQDYDQNFFEPYDKLISETPIYPSLGNHDVKTEGGSPYLENFHLPRNNPQHTERYYSFDWGDAHFAAVDSELYHDDGSDSPEEQKAWLERDLAASEKRWKFVFFHKPPYSSSEHDSDTKIRDDLAPVFERYGVDLVFDGHDHDYERTVPIRGVTYVVTGGGGKDLYGAGRSEWTAFSKSVHHATKVRVDGGRLTLEAVEPDDTVIDRLRLGGKEGSGVR